MFLINAKRPRSAGLSGGVFGIQVRRTANRLGSPWSVLLILQLLQDGPEDHQARTLLELFLQLLLLQQLLLLALLSFPLLLLGQHLLPLGLQLSLLFLELLLLPPHF